MRFKALIAILSAIGGIPPSSFAVSLQTGDILLQSIPCYVCSLIEIEENSPYSHMGIAVVDSTGVSVLESWSNVSRISLREFLSRRRKKTETLVLRPIAFEQATARVSTRSWIAVFERWFAGKHYDSDFSWNNADDLGEKYYCSEFVAKFMNHFLPIPISTKPMHFDRYRDDWIKYFKGNPPDGMPGISPGDFERSPLFRKIGLLSDQ